MAAAAGTGLSGGSHDAGEPVGSQAGRSMLEGRGAYKGWL